MPQHDSPPEVVRAGLQEVSLPEASEQEELELYRKYRLLGGMALPEYEEQMMSSGGLFPLDAQADY